MSMFRLSFLVPVVLISACSSDGEERPDYLDSQTLSGLQVPPQLTRPDARKEMKIPQPSDKALALLQQRTKAEGRVAPVFAGVELKSDQGMHWLEIQEDADSLWLKLRDFWAHEGIELGREEPLLGLMETDWVNEYKAKYVDEEGASWVKFFSPDLKDKFRLRVERVAGQKLTRVYVSHRGLETVITEDGSSWKSRVPDADLEYEILKRLVLFAGVGQSDMQDILAAYQPLRTRIKAVDEEATVFEIVGHRDFVWTRVIHALDRLGAQITHQNKAQGAVEVLIGELSSDVKTEVEDENALYEDSWLARLLAATSGEEANEKGQVTVFVQLTKAGHNTRMHLTLANKQPVKFGISGKFKQALVEFLK